MKIVMLMLLAMTNAYAQNFDFTDRFGIGASWGYNTPIFGNNLNSSAGADQSWDIHGRYHLNAASGLEAAFTKYEFSDVTSVAQVSDLTYFRRLNATDVLATIIGVGAGAADLSHYDFGNLKLGLKLRGGVEYTLVNHLSFGFNIDYQHIIASESIHILAARFGLTWYIGSHISASGSPAEDVYR